MKKIISCILILSLLLGLFSACSGGSENGTTTGVPVDNTGNADETWETLKYGSYLSDVRTFFETNLQGVVINNQGEGVFSVDFANGETVCEVRGAFNSALEKGDENLTVDFTYTGGLTDDTAKIEAALGYCGAIATPYIAGLTGSRVAPADVVNAIRDKIQAGTYETFTRGDGGRAVTIKTAGIPVAIFLYNSYDARMCVGSTPIEQHRLSLGMNPSTSAADDTSTEAPVKPEKSIVVSTEEYYERLKYYFPEIEEWVLIDEKENNRTYSTNGETENIKGLLSISDKSLIMTNYHGSFVVNYTIESNTKASIMIQEKKLGISEQWLFNLAGYILEYTGKKGDAATLISDSKAHAVVENGVENYTAVIHGVQYTVLRKTDKSNLTIMISFGGDYE